MAQKEEVLDKGWKLSARLKIGFVSSTEVAVVQSSMERSGIPLTLFTGPKRAAVRVGRVHLRRNRSYSALNSQPTRAMAAVRYIQTRSATPAPSEPYMTL
jgi:hypothetical protein